MSSGPSADRPAPDTRKTPVAMSDRDFVLSDGCGAPPADPISCQPTVASMMPGMPTNPSAAGAASLVGTKFGDFELLAELGRGGMGVVYKARQLSLDRCVAVKMLLAEHAQNPVVLARFLTEARTAAALDHPNIVKVFQVGEGALGHYFVMEFVDGPSLEKVIQRGPLPVGSAVALAVLVAEAVHYAHSKGVIHRDLKPANIMLDPARRPLVMDFGIAKFVGKSTALTQQGTIMGTPGYMPPEQAGEDTAGVGPHSDVYSLGAILYSMLSGRPPFEEGTALKTILKVVSEEPPPPVRSFRKEVPAHLEAICMKCLAKKPAERFATAKALAEELRRFRAGSPPGPDLAPAPAPAPALPSAALVNLATKKSVRLPYGATIIGRGADCGVIVRASDVSKRHCQITVDEDGAELEDLDSANGTAVNGQPVTRCRLKDGDRLDIAGHAFQVRLSKPKA